MFLKSKLFLSAILVVVIVIGVGGFLLTRNSVADKSTSKQTFKPSFKFDNSHAREWSSAGNNYPRDTATKDYVGDLTELPTVSMTIHHNDFGTSGCFVSYSYYQGKSIDIAAALKDDEQKQQSAQKSSPLSLVSTNSDVFSMTIDKGTSDITVHQYNLTGSYPGELLRGIEFGYVNTEKGHIKIQGNCRTADQLPETLTPLKAVVFNEIESKR